jgi:hypothetical protein
MYTEDGPQLLSFRFLSGRFLVLIEPADDVERLLRVRGDPGLGNPTPAG